MDIFQAIKDYRLIDINLFNGKLTFTGVCVTATRKIIALVGYDFKKKELDGFFVFRNKDFDSYQIWKRKEIKLFKNNIVDFINKYQVKKYNTFYSWFKKKQSDKELVSIYEINDIHYIT